MSDPCEVDGPMARIHNNQFKTNKSGNPAGRPKGSRNMKTIVQDIANEKHAFTEDGVTKSLSGVELLLKIAQQQAIKGDLRAAKLIDKVAEKYDTSFMEDSGVGFMLVPTAMTEENTPFAIEEIPEAES